MVHTIDGYTPVSFSVYNNVNPPHNPTTLVYTGQGGITVDLHDSSILIDQAGTGGATNASISAFARSTVIYEGDRNYVNISATKNVKVLYDGYADGIFSFFGNKNTTLEGNGFAINALFGSGMVFGDISTPFLDVVGDLTVFGMTIAGGGLNVGSGSSLRIFGGDYYLTEWLNIDGNVTLYGKSFSVPFGTYIASDQLTSLTGTLSDGGDIYVPDTLDIRDHGTLTLVKKAPGPSTLLLLGSGLIGLVGYGRKRLFKK